MPWVLLHTIISHPRYHRNFSFVTANKPPWIFPWLIPGARASRLITPWIILRPLTPLLWRHGFYAKIAGAIKCSNLKLVATQLDQPGNNIWMMQATQPDRAGNTNLAPFLLMDYLPLLAACSSPPFACIGCLHRVVQWICHGGNKSMAMHTTPLLHYSTTPDDSTTLQVNNCRRQFLCYSPTRHVSPWIGGSVGQLFFTVFSLHVKPK